MRADNAGSASETAMMPSANGCIAPFTSVQLSGIPDISSEKSTGDDGVGEGVGEGVGLGVGEGSGEGLCDGSGVGLGDGVGVGTATIEWRAPFPELPLPREEMPDGRVSDSASLGRNGETSTDGGGVGAVADD